MDRGAWRVTVHRVAKSQTQLTKYSTSRGDAPLEHKAGCEKPEVTVCVWASLGAQLVENPLAMQETWVQALGWATHSSLGPREFHGLYSPWGCKESDTTDRFSLSLSGCVYLVHCYDLTLHRCCLVAKKCPNL